MTGHLYLVNKRPLLQGTGLPLHLAASVEDAYYSFSLRGGEARQNCQGSADPQSALELLNWEACPVLPVPAQPCPLFWSYLKFLPLESLWPFAATCSGASLNPTSQGLLWSYGPSHHSAWTLGTLLPLGFRQGFQGQLSLSAAADGNDPGEA